MPTIANGGTATFTVAAGDYIRVTTGPTGFATLEAVGSPGLASGERRWTRINGRQVFGPWQAGTVRINALADAVDYDFGSVLRADDSDHNVAWSDRNGTLQVLPDGGFKSGGVLACSAVAFPLTGTTSATVLAAITVPGGSMGPNGGVRVTVQTSETNNANNKTLIVQWNGTPVYQAGANTVAGRRIQFEIWNRGAVGSQLCFATGVAGTIGNLGQPYVTTSFDTSNPLDVRVVATLANAADTFTLEAFCVELLRAS